MQLFWGWVIWSYEIRLSWSILALVSRASLLLKLPLKLGTQYVHQVLIPDTPVERHNQQEEHSSFYSLLVVISYSLIIKIGCFIEANIHCNKEVTQPSSIALVALDAPQTCT